jgi:hypothetical protein
MSKQPTTHLGNRELHRQHSIMITGGAIPVAKVMDQHVIDKYLMHGLLSLSQHRAGEFVLGKAADAGMWATGVNLSGLMVQLGKHDNVPFRLFPFGKILTSVRRQLGEPHVYVLTEVICKEKDVQHRKQYMTCLREALDCVANRYTGGNRHLRSLRRAVGASNLQTATQPSP